MGKDQPKISFVHPEINEELRTYGKAKSLGVVFLDKVNNNEKSFDFKIEVFTIDLVPEKDYVLNIQIRAERVDIDHFSDIFSKEKYLTINGIRTISYVPTFSVSNFPSGKYSIHVNLIEIVGHDNDKNYQGKVIDSKSLYLLFAESGDFVG